MAMNGNAMGTRVANAIINSKASAAAKKEVTEIWQKICTEIVDYIKENAEVPAGISVKTAGSATAQTGATDAPGKVI